LDAASPWSAIACIYAGAPLTDDLLGADNGAVQVFALDAIFADGFGD